MADEAQKGKNGGNQTPHVHVNAAAAPGAPPVIIVQPPNPQVYPAPREQGNGFMNLIAVAIVAGLILAVFLNWDKIAAAAGIPYTPAVRPSIFNPKAAASSQELMDQALGNVETVKVRKKEEEAALEQGTKALASAIGAPGNGNAGAADVKASGGPAISIAGDENLVGGQNRRTDWALPKKFAGDNLQYTQINGWNVGVDGLQGESELAVISFGESLYKVNADSAGRPKQKSGTESFAGKSVKYVIE